MISPDIRRFLHGTIRSVWALDLLLFLRRHVDESWTTERLTHELRSSEPLVVDILAKLQTAGLVTKTPDGTFRYQALDPKTETLVSDLEQIYRQMPLTLIKEIVSAPNEKIQSFADAFKFKGD